MVKTILYGLLINLGVMFGLAACGPLNQGSPATLTPIIVQLAWTHSAQFAGFYAADQNGYYAAEGLAVTFIEGGPFVDRLLPVLAGTAHFGMTSGSELIIARANNRPVKAVATILRRDPFAFFALAESGITHPEDFVGKTIQIRERSRPFLRAVMGRVGISPEQYTENISAGFEDLYSGKVDVAIGFITSQQIEAEKAGYRLNVIYPEDYGLRFYADVIFTTDKLIETDPELVASFLRATLKGWRYAVENSTEAGNLVVKYNPQADVSLENEKMFASLPLVNTGQDYIGWMTPEIWTGMADTLRRQGVITTPLATAEVYTTQFLNQIYRP